MCLITSMCCPALNNITLNTQFKVCKTESTILDDTLKYVDILNI